MYRGLAPHKFTPVPGVHIWVNQTPGNIGVLNRTFEAALVTHGVRRNEVETIFDFPGLLG